MPKQSSKSAIDQMFEADAPAPAAPARVKPDRTQAHMTAAHKKWQDGGELAGTSKEDFYGKLQDPERLAAVFGHLNYQVENGGIMQWIDNGYADPAWPFLTEYVTKYSPTHPGIAKLRSFLAAIEDAYEGSEADSLKDWVNKDNSDELGEAIQNEDWEEVYKLLGGTDLDQRMFDNAVQDKLKGGSTIRTYEENGQFGAKITLDDDEDVVLFDTGAIYGTDEEADQAANDREISLEDMDSDVADRIKDEVKSELAEEYSRFGGAKQTASELDRLDSSFYTFNNEVLADLESIIEKDFPPDAATRARETLSKFWGKAKEVAKKVAAPVVNAVNRVRQDFKGNESKTPRDVVNQLLDS